METSAELKRRPRRHFDEDIERVHQVLHLADTTGNDSGDERLIQDVRQSAVAMAVGAMDAYFCDAYVDCLTPVLRAYIQGKWQGDLPSEYAKRQLPAGLVLDSSREGRPLWSLRMATRKIVERENMLSISRIPEQFNGVLPPSHKFWVGIIDELIAYNYKKLTGITGPELTKMSRKSLGDAKKNAISKFRKRIEDTVQLRHDWVHNCGRPNQAIGKLPRGQAVARVREIQALVTTFDDHIQKYRLV